MRLMKNIFECEHGASSLGLSDTFADQIKTIYRPYGCIYGSHDWLSWNPSDGQLSTSVDCGSRQDGHTYDCICVLESGVNNC